MIDSWLSNTKFKVDTEFIHKEKFLEKYDVQDAKYPSAYLLEDGSLRLLISQEEIDQVTTITEMEDLVSTKLK
ncbi:MAG: hypothetical protein KGD68_04275 [Candidatus Lokiarchaeota archaeon]|nr:hypothetical protein [Candidatus Lokiarchaeota archaeon]